MNNYLPDFVIKSIIIGNAGVGKTSLLKRLTEKRYSNINASTIGVDFFTLYKYIKNHNVKIHFWDTAGHDSFQNLLKIYYKNNAICYVVYDVCNYSSFKSVPMWIDTFKKNSSNNNAIIVLLANKIDNINKRIISFEEGQKMAADCDALYIEISSKSAVNIEKIVIEPINILLEKYENKEFESNEVNGFRDTKKEEKKNRDSSKKCCIIS